MNIVLRLFWFGFFASLQACVSANSSKAQGNDTHHRYTDKISPQSFGDVGLRLELEEAVKSNDIAKVRRLIDNGTDLSARGVLGRTALHYAAVFGYLTIIEALVTAGAKIDLQDNDGYTPLHRAAQEQHFKSVQFLLNNGADVELTASNGVRVRAAIIEAGYAYLFDGNDGEVKD